MIYNEYRKLGVEKHMLKSIEEIYSNLKFFNKMYEIIRIVDPQKKIVINYRHNKPAETDKTCYDFWLRNAICNNCISMRAYNENDTFFKIEHTPDRIYMTTAIPVEIMRGTYVIELLKDITKSMIAGKSGQNTGSEIFSSIESINLAAVTDSLTKLYNRRYINERLPIDIIACNIEKKPLSLILADIDFFKNVNDSFGHIAGDTVLREFSKELTLNIRSESDWAARFGGEEFLICMKNTDSQTAFKIAERIRQGIENKSIMYYGNEIKVTASFGVYTVQNQDISPDEIIDFADKKMYEAKRAGRNKVIL